MRYALRRDLNDSELVSLALQMGATWHRYGPLDGWVSWHGQFFPVEIKAPDRENHRNQYTRVQQAFFAHCERDRLPYFVWRNASDVIQSLRAKQTA